MTVLEVYDTVVLRDDPTLVGTVERTSAVVDDWHNTSLEHLLIVNYTNVPERALIDFITSGVPPPGFVFVICVDEEQGTFLAHEDDLKLLSRSLDLGDVVKKHGQTSSMIGTVVNFTETYTLRPVFYETSDGRLQSSLDPNVKDHPRQHDDGCTGLPADHDVIYNVPAEEIINAQSVFDGTITIRNDWVGAVDASDFDIVLLLANESIAVLKHPADLHMPIRDPEKPLVSLPDYDMLVRPPVLGAFQGWSTIPAVRTPRFGSFVVTSKDTLSKSRWIRGQYNSATPHEGVVIGVVPRTIDVKWITSSPFTRKSLQDMSHPPSHRQMVFKNINTFTSQKDLKRKEGLKICDWNSYPSVRPAELTASEALRPAVNGTSSTRFVGVLPDLRPGDQVRWRDPFGAAVKYGGRGPCGHGAFNRINSDQYCPGWDVNYLTVVSKLQKVAVQWQDGSETTHTANELFRFGAFETTLVPGNIVLDRGGLKMAPATTPPGQFAPLIPSNRSAFNEMAFFERAHDLFPSKVGIIQAIDPQERLAKVRWFQHSNIVLTEGGRVLSPTSLFGSISDVVSEVSLYEIMTFPAFEWRTCDVVILPPNTTLERLQKALKHKSPAAAYDEPLAVNPNLDLGRLIARAQACLENSEVTQQAVCVDDVDGGDGTWVGEIIAIGLDGHLTIRMLGTGKSRDVRIPLDVVLAAINVDELGIEDDDLMEDLDEWWEDYVSGGEDYHSRSPSPISERIEYEGGVRMDEDEDDEAWMSDEDDVGSTIGETTQRISSFNDTTPNDLTPASATLTSEDVEMTDASTQTGLLQSRQSPGPDQSHSAFTHVIPSEPPLCFDVLSIPPPSDQFSAELAPNTSPAFLKRISKEHKALSSSLPDGQIYVRTYESRLDLLRCLIVGPPDTPYEDAPFLVDLYLGRNFPDEPPVAHFHSWTSGLGRINPNLYEEGKICLSLLGTWPGKESREGWTKEATILQVLVSLQGLVMVRNPFFNEAGFEGYEAGGGYKLEAAQYAEKAFVMARGFVKYALTHPPAEFGEILGWIYASNEMGRASEETRRGLLKRVLDRGHSLIRKSEEARTSIDGATAETREIQLLDAAGNTGDPTRAFLRPLSKGAVVMLRRLLAELGALGGY